MLFCQFARTVWREVKRVVPLKLERKAFASNKNWLFDFLGRASDLQATTLTVGFWHIWEARNEARNSDVKPDPCRTGRKILAYIDLIKQNLFKPVSEHRCASNSAATTWTPPPPDTVLVSSDAAIFKEAGCRGAGVILRDHHGAFVVGCRQHVVGLSSPELAEAVALRRAVQLARDEGMDKVIFETDCLSLVQRLNSLTMDRSSVGMLVAEIKVSGRGFTSISFRHVKRVFNQAAHLLAKSSLDVNSSCVFYSVPEFIRGTFCIDVS
jgi:ribonuclease HI